MIETIQDAPIASFLFLITIFTSIFALLIDNSIISKFVFSPYLVINNKEYFRLFSSALIHADWLHLIFNLYTFWQIAFLMENPIILGHLNFCIIYFGSLLISKIPGFIYHRHDPSHSALGASGAISGLIFSFILFYPNAQFFLFIPAWLFAILFLVFSYYAAKEKRDNIGHDAHLYGAFGGLLLTIILKPNILNHFYLSLF